MKKIGILYICTGPYCLFWKEFYKSFEDKFLCNFEKKYYVFTDSEKIYAEDSPNVKKYYLHSQPWPLITLLRFSTFLTIENELNQCDYLMFSNANIICSDNITEEEFLPRKQLGEDIFVTNHPGYFKLNKLSYPYDRNKKSLAYVPWNCGKNYVIGAMFGGTSSAFISMTKTLKDRIEEDLKHNIIAKWHDESHLNRYIIGRKDVRILHPMYCYPFGLTVSYERKISAVSKQSKFDVRSFKGQYENRKINFKRIINKLNKIIKLKQSILWFYDLITIKKITVIK